MPFLRFSRAGLNLDCLLDQSNVAQIFISFSVLLFSLTVHELAHAWTADRLGDPTARLLGRVSLNPIVHIDPIGTVLFPLIAAVSGVPLIGWAKPVPVSVRRLGHPRRDYVLVAAAGPASNLVLALIAAIALRIVPVTPVTIGEPNVSAPIVTLLAQLRQINVLLAVFNLIPIPPLDGSGVVMSVFGGPVARLYAVIAPFGFLILILLLTSGFLSRLLAPAQLAVLRLVFGGMQ